MDNSAENPYDGLERIFHEPKRLAIMSALCRSADGTTFTELRQTCDLTDGNLNRHLKVLEEAGAVSISKRFVGLRPQTTVLLSESGRARFVDYLEALELVLREAAQAVEESPVAAAPNARKVEA